MLDTDATTTGAGIIGTLSIMGTLDINAIIGVAVGVVVVSALRPYMDRMPGARKDEAPRIPPSPLPPAPPPG